jgi:hypothetical protein
MHLITSVSCNPQSLLATEMAAPQDVLQHCLTLFRKADMAGLRQYLPDSCSEAIGAAGSSGASPVPVPVGPWLQVVEQGAPLAPLAGLLDVGARRVLPGHLLRRSQVLSTLRPSPTTFQQRVALTACTGETSIFDWHLRWHSDADSSSATDDGCTSDSNGPTAAAATAAAAASTNSRGGRWELVSVRRDASTDVPLPSTPHPQ